MTDARRAQLGGSLRHYGVPEHLHEGLIEYVVAGRPTGGFLRSCLENDFGNAVTRAGADLMIEDLRAIAKWLYGATPQRCWGSPGVVKTWRGE